MARAAKTRADLAYLDSLALARSEGHSYAEIARAAGVSRQAVRQLMEGRAHRASNGA
jgi:hypothetical protein